MMREYMPNVLRRMVRKFHGNESGLTLIELAIVLVIIGLLTAPMMQAFRIYLENKHRGTTSINMNAIASAFTTFYSENGRYPCPSDRAIGFGTLGHGVERCTQIAALGAGGCTTNDGACRASNAASAFVQIGGVPYVTLGIPMAETIDGWNRSFHYAVTETMTNAETFDPSLAAVEIVDEHYDPINTVPVYHAVVVSAGHSGAGGYNIYGNLTAPCVASYRESENCDNDARFMTSLINEVRGPNFFDDYVLPSNWYQTGIWGYTPDELSDVNALNPGRVGIGTATPGSKLEVVGNVRTEELHGTGYCDERGEDCFPASFIGGEGDACGEGLVMYGIARNRVLCRSVSVTPTTSTCGTGQFATGINAAGRVICATP